jgi:predicted ATPase
MLTRLQVKGFKNLLDVDVRFGPFTCVAGRNAAGKSNLFDAIRFLHLLTQHPIMEAVKLVRETKGRAPDPRSLFTSFGDFVAPEIRFVADLLVNQEVQDDFGVSAMAAITSLRYTLALRMSNGDGMERLELAEESLSPVKQGEARRNLGFPTENLFRDSVIKGRRVGDFISTLPSEAGAQIRVHQDGHGGRTVPAPRSSRTVLGGTASSDFPTILAAHREMESWRTLLLEPSAMRAPAFYSDPRFLDARGANLPAAIERLRRKESYKGQVYSSLANQLSDLIDDIRDVRIRDDEKTETFTLEARGRDGVFHPAGSLSDGTLRFLVLSAIAIDPETTGVICLEEPENGIHPERIPAMVRLLEDIAVDPQHAVGPDNPFRQVVINTHSPVVIRSVNRPDHFYIDEQVIGRGESTGRVASVRVFKNTWREKLQSSSLPIAQSQIEPYLKGALRDSQGQGLIDFADPLPR